MECRSKLRKLDHGRRRSAGDEKFGTTDATTQNVRSIEWLTFFLADVQTGLGPFLAAYLAASGWNPGSVGYALTFGGLVSVAMQTPAGAIIDATRSKRALMAISLAVLVAGAVLLMGRLSPTEVYSAQFLIGSSGAFLAPTVAAISLGVAGSAAFDELFGKIQAFNSAGNVFTTMVGIGAALSNTVGGLLIQHSGFRASFLGLSGVALLAFALLWFLIPETLLPAVEPPKINSDLGSIQKGNPFAQ